MCKIEFETQKPGFVSVKVVDIIGTTVKSLINSYKDAGKHIIDFNNQELMPGKYYYKVLLDEKSSDSGSLNSQNVVTVGKVIIQT